MKTRPLLLAVALTVFAAVPAWGQTATTSVYGKWRVDRKKSLEATLARDESAPVLPHDERTICCYEFTPTGKLIASFHQADGTLQGKQSGGWRVLSEEHGGLKVELLLLDDAGEPNIKLPAMIQFIDSKSLQLDIEGNSEIMVLVKPQPGTN